MACKNVCKLCQRLIISTAVTFTAGTGLIITIPEGAYNNEEKYCIVVAQSIPTTTTIGSDVFIRIGTGTALYPLVKRNCRRVTACGIRTRTKYSTCCETTPTSGLFRLLGNPCCQPNNDLRSINGTAPAIQSVSNSEPVVTSKGK